MDFELLVIRYAGENTAGMTDCGLPNPSEAQMFPFNF